MPWIRLDDHFDENPKILRAGPACAWIWLRCLAYCNRNLTDGFVPDIIAQERCASADPIDAAARLEEAGLWTKVENGYQIHDYLDYQGSKAEILAARAATRTRVQAFRQRRGNAVTNAVGNGVSTPSPTPKKKKDGQQSLSPSSQLGLSTHLSPSGHASGETGGGDPDEITATQAFHEVFWPAYPRKVAKARAFKAWRGLKLKDTDDKTLEKIMVKLHRCIREEWANRDMEKIPHPATWIHDRRWED